MAAAAGYVRFAALAATGLLACELVLRAAGYSSPVWYRHDPVLGWTLRPGTSGWYTQEGRSFVRINSAGQRDREHAIAKPHDVYRIAVLGDAYSEAMQVPLEQTYWAQLPGRLESCGFQRGRRIEVMNFGVRDYGTAQALLVLKTKALHYRPDLVLLQISSGQDLRDNSFALDALKGRPYFVLDASGGPRLDDSFRSRAAYAGRAAPWRERFAQLTDRVRTLQLARNLWRELRRLQSAHARDSDNVAGLEAGALAPPRDARWQDAWRITEALIAEVGRLAARNGAGLMLLSVPFAMQAHPDASLRAALQAQLGVPDFSYAERRLASYAAQAGIPAIALGPEMQALASATGAYLYGFDNAKLGFFHWNARGHRAAADAIAQRLCK